MEISKHISYNFSIIRPTVGYMTEINRNMQVLYNFEKLTPVNLISEYLMKV